MANQLPSLMLVAKIEIILLLSATISMHVFNQKTSKQNCLLNFMLSPSNNNFNNNTNYCLDVEQNLVNVEHNVGS